MSSPHSTVCAVEFSRPRTRRPAILVENSRGMTQCRLPTGERLNEITNAPASATVGCRFMNRDTDWDGRPIYYDRQGQPMTMHQWAEKFQDEDYTHIARDVIGPVEPLDPAPLITVSTFWLGVNPNWRNDEPLIYETLIIGGGYDATGMRYATEKQAREGHRRVVDELRAGRGAGGVSPLAPPAHPQSTVTHDWHVPRPAVSADGSSHGRHRRVAHDN